MNHLLSLKKIAEFSRKIANFALLLAEVVLSIMDLAYFIDA